ncbi:MAG TPA: DeoR/GlpR family DNA-binding transcription regulator [Pseudonocardia sp.]|nr:DeoR/GlpR family DNA-binding transcription regulator [Pseudonocardia sp.]
MTDPDLRYEGARERRTRILAALRRLGFLSITDLARDLRVSPMTVRRDLHMLESSGEVRLVHGGASIAPDALGAAYPRDGMSAARDRVATLAAGLVGSADTIAVDAGPTAHALVRALPDSFTGSVITHSMPVLQLLTAHPSGARLVALGGELRPDRHAFVGPCTETARSAGPPARRPRTGVPVPPLSDNAPRRSSAGGDSRGIPVPRCRSDRRVPMSR